MEPPPGSGYAGAGGSSEAIGTSMAGSRGGGGGAAGIGGPATGADGGPDGDGGSGAGGGPAIGAEGGSDAEGGLAIGAGGGSDVDGGPAADGRCWHLAPIDKVRFYPAPGLETQMQGARIVGSNDNMTNGFVDLATIGQTPVAGQWTELSFANTTAYRWVKYYGPPGSHGAVAELEFYAGSQRLVGKGFGTSGSRDNSGNTFDRAFDGDTTSFFEGPQVSDQYVGLDLASDNVAATPIFSPASGSYSSPQNITISSATALASIHYTTEGSTPSSSSMAYAGPVVVGNGTTVIKAIASANCMLDSSIAQGSFRVGNVGTAGTESSMHIGNSLTDTIDGFLEPIAKSGGITLDFHRDTVPGAGTAALWNDYREAWVPDLQSHRYDHLTMQPFPNLPCYPAGNGSDSDYVNRFYGLVKQGNPDVQLWIYQQWPNPAAFSASANPADRGDCLSGGGWLDPGWSPPNPSPTTWEDGLLNQLAYQEEVRQAVMDLNPGGKTIYLIPGGLALLNLKKEVEAGHVPGVGSTDFFHLYFIDDGSDQHLLAPGRWFISLVFYACMFQKNPAGVDRATGGVSAEQAAKLEEIVWSTVNSYRYSGVNR